MTGSGSGRCRDERLMQVCVLGCSYVHPARLRLPVAVPGMSLGFGRNGGAGLRRIMLLAQIDAHSLRTPEGWTIPSGRPASPLYNATTGMYTSRASPHKSHRSTSFETKTQMSYETMGRLLGSGRDLTRRRTADVFGHNS